MGKHGMARITGGFLGTTAVVLLAVGTSLPATAAPAASQDQSGGACVGHHPNPAAWYTGACSGHDEPELDPVSSLRGSAQDLTWTEVLPADGTVPVSAVGPTFWWGGAVSDPTRTHCSGRLSSRSSSIRTPWSTRAPPMAVTT